MRLPVPPHRTQAPSREPGQIIVLFAVFVIVLMVLAGSAYDYASIVVDDARLQNAVDAAVLAGSNSLVSNAAQPGTTAVAVARSTAVAYLAVNGVATATPGTNITMTFPPSTPIPGIPTPSTQLYENMTVDVTRSHPNSFWPLIGLNSVNLHGVGGAHAARSMLDVYLSLDTTGSLVTSQNLTDKVKGVTYTTIQDAVTAFVNAMNPTSNDPRGAKIGIGRYAGIKCANVGSDPTVLNIYSSGPGDYQAPSGGSCTDDVTILSTLSNNRNNLLQIAAGPSAGCPADANYACPIQHRPYSLNGPNSPSLHLDGSDISMYLPMVGGSPGGAPYYTGTKEPNAICLVNPADTGCPHTPGAPLTAGWGWTTANGARNCQPDGASWPCPAGTSQNQARRVLIIMTDGQDESWPTTLSSGDPTTTPDYGMPENGVAQPIVATYDSTFQTLANRLKATQADGSPGVEIYVVGFFCTNKPWPPSQPPPYDFCQSQIAYQTPPRACPGPSYTFNPGAGATGSKIDDLLVKVSSSRSGTCDHYFAISKSSDSLSGLFAAMAGQISRGQLTQ
jgi:Flp pilus assembly protein TadG